MDSLNSSFWKKNCKTKDILLPQEDKMKMLNIRSGEEDLVVRNAVVWTDKIQNVSKCKQVTSILLEIVLAGTWAKLWCRIPTIWSMPARGSLCEGLSLAINQSDRYCLSLEQDHAQVVGWQGWDSLYAHWSLKAKNFWDGWVKVTSSACLTWDLRHSYLPHGAFQLWEEAVVLPSEGCWTQYQFSVHPDCIWCSKR